MSPTFSESSAKAAELTIYVQSNPEIRQWMQSSGVADYAALEQEFERRVLALAAAAGRSYIVWQDVLDNGVKVCACAALWLAISLPFFTT